MEEKQDIHFEEAMSQLEEVVRRLEHGDLTLEEALHCFQEGIRLVSVCNQRLQKAENQVEILLQQLEGSLPEEGEG